LASYEMWFCLAVQVVAMHFEGSYCLNLQDLKDKRWRLFFLSLSHVSKTNSGKDTFHNNVI
jgi:hypothetical protein